jgi:hypothetical protein
MPLQRPDEAKESPVNTATWIAQGVLALVLFGAGAVKLIKSKKDLIASGASMAWAEDFSAGVIKLIGVLEVAGAIGLVLPWALQTVPVLTPLAGVGAVLLFLAALAVHLRRHETKAVGGPILFALLGAFIALSRFGIIGS